MKWFKMFRACIVTKQIWTLCLTNTILTTSSSMRVVSRVLTLRKNNDHYNERQRSAFTDILLRGLKKQFICDPLEIRTGIFYAAITCFILDRLTYGFLLSIRYFAWFFNPLMNVIMKKMYENISCVSHVWF